MKSIPYEISAEVWLYPGMAGWHFVTIQKEDAEEIQKQYLFPRRGFGSIPVHVTVGKTRWKTSIFPEKKGTYLLPLKKEIRMKEDIQEGDRISIILEVIT